MGKKMEMLLIREGLWSIVAARMPRPQPAPGPATRREAVASTVNNEEIAKWEDYAECAMSTPSRPTGREARTEPPRPGSNLEEAQGYLRRRGFPAPLI